MCIHIVKIKMKQIGDNKMKKKPKVHWTAKEFVQEHGEGEEVGIIVTIYNLAELGFKYALKTVGKKYGSAFYIPTERYLVMSAEEKSVECEKHVQEMLARLSEAENRGKKVEEIGKTISKEVIIGEISVPEVRERKPLKIVDKELVQKIAREAKKLVYDSPEMRKVLTLKELLTVAGNYDLDENWLSTAGYLLIEEIALKQWLLQHDHSEQDLRRKDYQTLLRMLENDFKRIGKPINARDISRFLGEREFRNRVLHEGYSPSPRDAKETKEMALGLLGFLKGN